MLKIPCSKQSEDNHSRNKAGFRPVFIDIIGWGNFVITFLSLIFLVALLLIWLILFILLRGTNIFLNQVFPLF